MDVAAVLDWGLPRLRDLPWRQTRDPWAVLVSEVMAQQTQTLRVIPKWLAFLEAFPTPADCAAASLGDVLRLWQGLGYPRRARNLQAAAIEIVRLGGFPSDLHGLLELPGVGAYTARAVLAFAFEAEAAVVDTNVGRIFARHEGRRLTAREAQTLADATLQRALDVGDSWSWNQCVMELGALLCRPLAPACGECPLRATCTFGGAIVRGASIDDPATGSAGVSRPQGRFEGSERQARGRLMRALSNGPVRIDEVEVVMQHPASRRLADALCAEGLVCCDGAVLRLP